MNELVGQKGELAMTIEITRAATGETDVYDIIGTVTNEEIEQLIEDKD